MHENSENDPARLTRYNLEKLNWRNKATTHAPAHHPIALAALPLDKAAEMGYNFRKKRDAETEWQEQGRRD